jgi:hypothetical protein
MDRCAETIRFEYCDQDGVLTERYLTSFLTDGRLLNGFDLDRNMARTFRLGRVTMWGEGAQALVAAHKVDSLGLGRRHASQPLHLVPEGLVHEGPVVLHKGAEILFTGFTADERAQLEALARAAGLRVRASPTVHLACLVVGGNAGPTKIAMAAEVGAVIIDREGFQDSIRAN